MAAFNLTPSSPTSFILNGISDLKAEHIWITILFSTFCILSLLGNSIVILVISKEQTLHKPMYLLLCMLALTDISLSTFIVLNTLRLFWFNLKKITLEGCLTQVLVLYSICAMHSAILVTMAFDRYVAICDPLRYTTILTNARIAKLALVGLIRTVLLVFPLLLFLQNLPSCANPLIPHVYCEFMTLMKMSCVNPTISWMYSFVLPLVIIVLDLTLIGLSYVLIIRAVLRTSSKRAHQRALNTCTTHICVIVMSYTSILVYTLSQRFGKFTPAQIHILLASLYSLVPPMLNPIIYGIKTKELSQKLRKYLCILATVFKHARRECGRISPL